jgi:hypothetical protein
MEKFPFFPSSRVVEISSPICITSGPKCDRYRRSWSDIEGIVAKRSDAPYRVGKCDAWLKIKNRELLAARSGGVAGVRQAPINSSICRSITASDRRAPPPSPEAISSAYRRFVMDLKTCLEGDVPRARRTAETSGRNPRRRRRRRDLCRSGNPRRPRVTRCCGRGRLQLGLRGQDLNLRPSGYESDIAT